MQKTGFLTAFWALAKPYWFSAQRKKGLVLLATVVVLSLGSVWLEVQFNTWNKNFYNALEQKDQGAFFHQLVVFTVIALVWIAAQVYKLYLQQMLQIEWRTWLNEHFLADWLRDRAYYRMQLLDRGVDNPDQRIAEDLRLFVDNTLDLAIGFLSAVVMLVSFTIILWELSGDFTIGGFAIPGFMFWVALVYTGIGSWLTYRIGRPLVKLNFNQQRFEADYRYALVRLRENSEGVALYKGEPLELATFRERFRHVIDNWWGIMRTRKQLNWFVSFFYQFSVPFPYLVAAPKYFAGTVGMGYIFQVGNSFTQVQSSLTWFITAYTQLAAWKATIDRLTTFSESLEQVKRDARDLGGERAEDSASTIGLEGLELAVPEGKPLLAATTIEFRPGEDVLVTGPSGAGKSTLFRTLAGIWPYWKGRMRLPQGARLLFLPQKPYLPIGSLRRAVTYPADSAQFSDRQVADALQAVGLAALAGDLERSESWAQVLSGGEQQRLAFARALLNAPDWLFLDEATASLPEEDQETIGHRASLRTQHERHLAWHGERLAAAH
jgi:vitamin B12/bleomycin/antimicrobial peptide transport system ATP-binding/permease protein